MSLRPQPIASVPADTTRVARAALPHGHPSLTCRDALGTIFQDTDGAARLPLEGQPGLPPWRVALVPIRQFRAHLADRQAAEAVRARIAWKDLLGLELTAPGFAWSVCSEFRDRVLDGRAEALWRDTRLERCRARGWRKARGLQRTDSTPVRAAIRVLNRLERVAETLRATRTELATVAPDWRRGLAPLEWYDRDSQRMEATRVPTAEMKRQAYAQLVGEDGCHWLDAVAAPAAPAESRA
jgi:transposase